MTRRHTPERPLVRDILPHLQRVRKLHDGSYTASCPLPTHGKRRGDLRPSLQLWENADGTLAGAKCYGECDQRELWRKLLELAGVRPATARPIAPRRNRQQPATAQAQPLTVAEYARAKGLDADRLRAWGLTDLPEGGIEIPYRNTDGETACMRYRLALEGENRFRWRQGDAPILYGLWRWSEWQDADALYLCEGETDTLTLWHADLPALGIPGAGVWKAAWWRAVEGFARIVVIPDNDASGAGLVQRLAGTCPESIQERVQVLQLPEGVKDANELWQQVDADPERFREALAQCNILAIWQFLKGLPDCQIARNDSEDDLPLLAPLSELLSSDAEHELEYVPLLGVDGLIARGTLTLIGAHPKAGKTTLLIHACREWLQQGLRVVYLSEDSRAIWRERVKRFPELSALILNTIPRAHPENWARAVREQEPDMVIVDTIRRFMPAKDENDSASVSLALTPFVDLQQELPRTAIVLVHHTKKSLSSDGEITDIAGSHAFTAEVDAILLLAPVREHKRQRILTPIAGRLWTLSPEPLVLELSEDGSEYRVVGTAEEVLPETHAQSTREKVLQAIRVLGEATRTEIEEYLREIGEKIPERTIRDALLRLYEDGKVEREGKGTRAEPHVYRAVNSGNLAIWQSLNTLPDCQNLDAPTAPPPAAPPEPTPYDPRSESFEEWLARADTVLDHFYPSFHARAELTWDTIDDWLQQASMPHDPLGLEPHEVDALRVLLAFAEARGFPPLTIPEWNYTIRTGQAGWLNALPDIAGTPAVAVATRLLQSLDAAGSPDAPTPTFTNGNAGLTPLQFTLIQEV
jgi:DNA-binding transcriptional ArsR family regulator